MNKTKPLPDTQSKYDSRNIVINKVGIKDIKHPIIFIDKDKNPQPSIGLWTMTTELAADIKGTHMSRFIEILNQEKMAFSSASFAQIVQKIAHKLDSNSAEASVDFNFFRKKIAPVSKVKSYLDYHIKLSAYLSGKAVKTRIKVVVPVTSLCPCSKSIAEYGAHNQRSTITIDATISKNLELLVEDLIDVAESSASSELFAILKRDDEKFVTERAYENPAFVEDVVRDIAQKLNYYSQIESYILESENFESIHNHSAYAYIEK